MKSKKLYQGILIFCLLTIVSLIFGQGGNPAYHFEGEDVVFLFDIRDYQNTIDEESAQKLDFSDLEIKDVAISGNFNNWSGKGWKMKKKSVYIYELRKPIAQFSDIFNWELRYIINGKHIISEAMRFAPTKSFEKSFLKEAFDLNINQIEISDSGNVRFFLPGFQDKDEVVLTGSFNAWDEHEIKMNKISSGWELKAHLKPGVYEYKFIADGNWMHDPHNTKKKINEYATFNSLLEVTVPVEFLLNGFGDAEEVIVAGSFNNWNEHQEKMMFSNGQWSTTLNLPGGKHFYKFIVDGSWMTDPENLMIEDDGKGNMNSVLLVR